MWWKNYKTWGIVVLIICLLGGAYYFYNKQQAAKTTNQYTTGTVEKGKIQTTISATGTINPVKYVDVSTNVAGTLEEVLVTENQQVQKGDVIARIDTRQLQANADDAAAVLANAETDMKRYEALVAEDAVARQTYDSAVKTYKSALAAYQRAAANLSDATITAPMSGTVIGTPLKAGQTISTGISTQMIIATIADLSNLEIYLTVDETDVGNVKKGSKVEFTVDSYPGKTFTGTVSEIAKGTKGNMGTTSSSVVYYTVKVSIPASESADLLPTMTARATIYGAEEDNALIVPITAVRTDTSGEYVYVIKNGTPERTTVKTGTTSDSNIQIVSGLNEGDEIVVSGDVTTTKKSSKGGGGPMF